MRKFLFSSLITLLLLLSSCIKPYRNAEHQLGDFCNWYSDINSNEDLKTINEQLFSGIFDKCEYKGLLRMHFRDSVADPKLFSDECKLLHSKQKQLTDLIFEALDDSGKQLMNDSITVIPFPCFAEDKASIKELGGVLGVAPGNNIIVLFINVDSDEWMKMLPYAIAHEYYHTYWIRNQYKTGVQTTLADYLVFEGKAEAFAQHVYPGTIVPWTNKMDDKDKNFNWRKIKPRLTSTDFNLHADVMFGLFEFPKWTGYIIGYDATQKYLQLHPELKPEEWHKISSTEILKNYNP